MVRAGVEGFDLGVAVCLADCAVYTAAAPIAELGSPVLKNVQLRLELREYEDFMAFFEESWDKAVEEEHLARCCD